MAIPAALGGMYIGVVALFLVFAGGNMQLLVPIAWAFVVLGIASVFFAYLASKNKGK